MIARTPIPNVANPPLPVGDCEASRKGGLGVRSMAAQFLKAAAVSTEKAVEMMKLTKTQIEVAMFTTSVGNIERLMKIKLSEL